MCLYIPGALGGVNVSVKKNVYSTHVFAGSDTTRDTRAASPDAHPREECGARAER